MGDLAKGVSGFDVHQDASGKIILEPYVEIPANEKWLFDNKTALKKVTQGLEDQAKRLILKRGSFAQFMDDDGWYLPYFLPSRLLLI